MRSSKKMREEINGILKKGETMEGVCEREDGKMVFQLHRYDLDD
ncbi:hypothetical protein [Massilia horti]|nr:hypothetical protein [Massilia horti]